MLWIIIIVALAVYFLKTYVYQPILFWKQLGIPYANAVPIFGNSFKVIFKLESIVDTLTRLYNEFPTERYVLFLICRVFRICYTKIVFIDTLACTILRNQRFASAI